MTVWYEGLTKAQKDLYTGALAADSISIRINITLLNNNEKEIGSLSADNDYEKAVTKDIPGVVSGQVDMDMEAEIERQLQITLYDPQQKLSFDKTNPFAPLYMDRHVSAEHLTWVEALDEWVNSGVMWGPITRFSRTGAEVTIEAHSKEALGLAPNLLWTTIKLHKGMYVTDAIKKLLRQNGEQRFSLPDINRKLHKDIIAARHTQPWKLAKRLAASIDRQLYYDGRGRVCLRRWPDEPSLVMADGYQRGF